MGIACYMIEPVFHETALTTEGKPAIVGWRRPDTGEEQRLVQEFAPGAMWYSLWLERQYKAGRRTPNSKGSTAWHPGPDGRILSVLTPGGVWIIDSRASNCTLPYDNEHHCWIRHGTPPMITVDKNGNTCQAGAGSIQCGPYHGFLRNGELVE